MRKPSLTPLRINTYAHRRLLSFRFPDDDVGSTGRPAPFLNCHHSMSLQPSSGNSRETLPSGSKKIDPPSLPPLHRGRVVIVLFRQRHTKRGYDSRTPSPPPLPSSRTNGLVDTQLQNLQHRDLAQKTHEKHPMPPRHNTNQRQETTTTTTVCTACSHRDAPSRVHFSSARH